MILASQEMSVFIAPLSLFTQSVVGGMHLASFPGSPLAPAKNKMVFIFGRVRGEPGTSMHLLCRKVTSDNQPLGSCAWAAVVWLYMTFEPSLSCSDIGSSSRYFPTLEGSCRWPAVCFCQKQLLSVEPRMESWVCWIYGNQSMCVYSGCLCKH